MSEFYATTNPDGTIEPHWVEGQREILSALPNLLNRWLTMPIAESLWNLKQPLQSAQTARS